MYTKDASYCKKGDNVFYLTKCKSGYNTTISGQFWESIFLLNVFRRMWSISVSYTHLDVYKRQTLLMRGEQNEKVLFLDGPGGSG